MILYVQLEYLYLMFYSHGVNVLLYNFKHLPALLTVSSRPCSQLGASNSNGTCMEYIFR